MNNNSKIETLEEEKKKAEESLKTRMDEFNLLEVRNIQVNMRIICIENVFFFLRVLYRKNTTTFSIEHVHLIKKRLRTKRS